MAGRIIPLFVWGSAYSLNFPIAMMAGIAFGCVFVVGGLVEAVGNDVVVPPQATRNKARVMKQKKDTCDKYFINIIP